MLTLFFDLDGTLLDSQSGIVSSIQHAMIGLGAEEPAADELRGLIGMPLPFIFSNLLGESGDIAGAVDLYRAYYTEEAMFDAVPYNGIGEMFDELLTVEARLFIATSKPQVYAQQIAEHFGLLEPVERLFGSELDGSNSDKTALLQFALDEIGEDPSNCIMVGDRQMDIFGAKNNDIPNIGALWGYADQGELHLAEADMLAAAPEEIPEIAYDLLGLEA
ncbi:MAG: HAD hydrolase-like protein [Rhodobacterales bacterium]